MTSELRGHGIASLMAHQGADQVEPSRPWQVVNAHGNCASI